MLQACERKSSGIKLKSHQSMRRFKCLADCTVVARESGRASICRGRQRRRLNQQAAAVNATLFRLLTQSLPLGNNQAPEC